MVWKVIAVEVAVKGAATVGRKLWEIEAVKKTVTTAAGSVALTAVAGAPERGNTYLADRKRRRLAMDLARQIGGRVSVSTVIAGDRYDVVWRGDEPVGIFPALPENLGPLNERFELTSFVGHRVRPRDKRHRLARVSRIIPRLR